jgi:hypothetical protein
MSRIGVVLIALLAAACAQPAAAPTATPRPTAAPTVTPAQPTATPVPPTATRPPTPIPPTPTPVPPAPPTPTVTTPTTSFVSLVGGRPGGTARAVVQALPGASCSIVYVTPAGTVSQAQGLVNKTGDKAGRVEWSWIIGTATRPGTGTVTVTCNGSTARSPIQIG